MQVTVQSGYAKVTVTMNTHDTIESVMRKITEEVGIPPELQRFIVENENEGDSKGKGRRKGKIICEQYRGCNLKGQGVGWGRNKGKSKKGPY